MLGTLAAIFGLLGSKKWIMREGANRDFPQGSGSADGERPEKVSGVLHGAFVPFVKMDGKMFSPVPVACSRMIGDR